MSTEYGSTMSEQVAHLYIGQFPGVTDATYGNPDTGHFEGAGVIMATLIRQGENERFQSLVEDLAPNPNYQVGALVNALEYCERSMLSPIFGAIDTIRPEDLPVETRVGLMAGITKALLREDSPHDSIEPAWGNYEIPADDLFEEATGQPYVDPDTVSDVMYASRFTDIPDMNHYVGYLTATIDHFVHSPEAGREIFTGFGTVRLGEMVASGALHALSLLKFTEQEQRLVNSLVRDPSYSPTVVTHVETLLREDKTTGVTLYENLQEKRDDIAYMQVLDTMHAKYLARHGNIEPALAYAETLPVYQDRVWIMVNAARYVGQSGDIPKATELLRQATALDPLAVEPYRADGEDYDDVYEGMPEVDTDDPESITKYNNEASIRAALNQKGEWDLRGERGFMRELVAETAANLGAFDVALDAYGGSRQYPMQTELRMAESATEQGRMRNYVRAILSNTTLGEIIRPRVLEAALQVFHQRSDRFDDNGTGQAIQDEIQALARNYAHQRLADLMAQGRRDGLNLSPIAELLVQCGDYKEALALIKLAGPHRANNIVSGIIKHKAYKGLTADAAALYMHSPHRPTETISRDSALRAIVHNSLLLADEASARVALLEVPGYSRRSLMSGVLHAIGSTVTEAPSWIINLAVGTEDYVRTDVKAISNAIHRAKLVTKRAADSGDGALPARNSA